MCARVWARAPVCVGGSAPTCVWARGARGVGQAQPAAAVGASSLVGLPGRGVRRAWPAGRALQGRGLWHASASPCLCLSLGTRLHLSLHGFLPCLLITCAFNTEDSTSRRKGASRGPCRRCPILRKSKAKPNGKKPAAEERKAYLEPEHTKARITDFQFKELVVLPREIDLNEWLASNTTTFFHHINLQYSTISEFCTGEACQTMAVCNTQYYWYDERGKKVKCTAPQYVDFVMSSVQKLVTDEDVFPTKYENSPAPLSPWCGRSADTCSTCWRTSTGPTSRRRWPWSCTDT
ncbi:MOB kinase activator 2 isoform X3 [Macaca fascicularis]|uniref:MOB kinase activator 2 isoform X3 n=1 Tax=Macaca fascicularis TaxID=9541 RepID=UPI0032B057B1